MASNPLLTNSGNTRAYNYPSPEPILARSTRLVTLGKVINSICSIPRPHPDGKKKMLGFDLNQLPPVSPPPSPPRSPAQSESNAFTAFECSSWAVECDPKGPQNSPVAEEFLETEIVGENSEIVTQEVTQPPPQNVFVPRGRKRCLDLLIEAAKLISGGFGDDDEIEVGPVVESEGNRKRKGDPIPGKKRRSKRLRDIESVTKAALVAEAAAAATAAAAEGKEPGSVKGRVTRSRSGRSQVVPLKYREI